MRVPKEYLWMHVLSKKSVSLLQGNKELGLIKRKFESEAGVFRQMPKQFNKNPVNICSWHDYA